jgi:glycerol-3-phosphate dehydrogenase
VRDETGRPFPTSTVDFDHPGALRIGSAEADALKRLVAEEAVMTLDDLLDRRTNWGIVERDVVALRQRVCDAIGWRAESKTSPGGRALRSQTVPVGSVS